MRTLKFTVISLLAVATSLQQIKYAESSTIRINNSTTTRTVNQETAGQLLDKTFSLLKKEFEMLKNDENEVLKKKVELMRKDIEMLKQFHRGKCGSCKNVEGMDHYCDCTSHKPKKDCLEFYQAGFKVSEPRQENIAIIELSSTVST